MDGHSATKVISTEEEATTKTVNGKRLKIFDASNVTINNAIDGKIPEKEISPEIRILQFNKVQNEHRNFCLHCAVNLNKNGIQTIYLIQTLQVPEHQ